MLNSILDTTICYMRPKLTQQIERQSRPSGINTIQRYAAAKPFDHASIILVSSNAFSPGAVAEPALLTKLEDSLHIIAIRTIAA